MYQHTGPLNALLGLCLLEGDFFFFLPGSVWERKKDKRVLIVCKCSFKSHGKSELLEGVLCKVWGFPPQDLGFNQQVRKAFCCL